MRVGIITFHDSMNYGAHLQCFALQSILQEIGCEVIILNRGWGGFSVSKQKILMYNILKRFISCFRLGRDYYFSMFRKDFFNLTDYIDSQEKLLREVNKVDIVIVGSDQVWNCDCINEMGLYYYLDWVPEKIKKYSYAASFGKDEFDVDEDTLLAVSKTLSQYDAISVREDTGVEICRKILGVEATFNIDPTLLYDNLFYRRLYSSEKKKKEKTLCTYFLDKSIEKQKVAMSISRKKGLQIVNNSPKELKLRKRILFYTWNRLLPISAWIQNIAEADYVITDSYHGVIFSIIFQKQFICFNNKKRGAARFLSLLNLLNLSDRLVESGSQNYKELIDNLIDYSLVGDIVALEQEKAMNYLKTICKS